LHQKLEGMQESHFNASDLAMRRGAGLYILHEKVSLKETPSPAPALLPPPAPTPAPARTTRRKVNKIELVRQQAAAELEQYRALPAASLKWTWGPDLDEDDILEVLHPRHKTQHSGYHEEMPDGRCYGVWDDTDSLPTGTAVYSSLAPDGLTPRFQSLDIDSEGPASPAGNLHVSTDPTSNNRPVDNTHAGAGAGTATAAFAASLWLSTHPSTDILEDVMDFEWDDDDIDMDDADEDAGTEDSGRVSHHPSDLRTAADAANAWLSAASPSSAAIAGPAPHVYGPEDFGFVDDSWVPDED
jgi:hypothetical protein